MSLFLWLFVEIAEQTCLGGTQEDLPYCIIEFSSVSTIQVKRCEG